MFAPVNADDPAVIVDELSDLFEAQIPPELDPTLDASSLDEFFPERETFDDDLSGVFEEPAHASRPVPAPRPVLMLVKPREEPREEAVESPAEYEEVPVPEPIVAAAPASTEPDVVLSPIQRAAMDFERFAATFHAFATECQGLRTF